MKILHFSSSSKYYRFLPNRRICPRFCVFIRKIAKFDNFAIISPLF
ncbi:hypothetical protein ACWIUD_07855 [Helicobacter sp. 23-1044]